MSKDFYYSSLLDFYGELLNDKQREAMECYYNNDLSLSEIADNFKISKQGVRDIVKRAEKQLEKTEEKLHLMDKFNRTRERLNFILITANEIEGQIKKGNNFKNTEEMLNNIKVVAKSLYEEI